MIKTKQFLKDQKSLIVAFVIIAMIGLFTFLPSFSLHFDGDSYLVLWFYKYYVVKGFGESWSVFKYFFTDYGSPAIIFNLIYQIVGLTPVYFYIISFILRLLAAFSFYPLLHYLTKNKMSSLFSVLFFLVSTTGLETTNWVFNMPSYISIVFLNLFLVIFFITVNKISLSHLLFTGSAFLLSITIQPIRMVFLPFLTITLPFLLIRHPRRKYAFIIASFCLILFALLFAFGDIGGSVGVTGSPLERVTGTWISNTSKSMNGLSSMIHDKKYKGFLFLVGQVGYIVLPYDHLGLFDGIVSSKAILLKLVIPELLLFFLTIVVIRSTKYIFNFRNIIVISAATIWSYLIWSLFHSNTLHPFSVSQILSLIAGGHFILFTLYYLYSFKKTKHASTGVLLFLLIIIFGFLVYWVRNPNSLRLTTNRYLIVSSAGLAALLGMLLSLNKNYYSYLILSALIPLHILGSRNYLCNLHQNRNFNITEPIRNSVPKIDSFAQEGASSMVYLESDDEELLYHTLAFGFPVMMSFYQEFDSIWNIAVTQSWQEVVDAYLTGEGFRRFGTIPIEPAKLENVHSFRLQEGVLIDTSEPTRQKLKGLNLE